MLKRPTPSIENLYNDLSDYCFNLDSKYTVKKNIDLIISNLTHFCGLLFSHASTQLNMEKRYLIFSVTFP